MCWWSAEDVAEKEKQGNALFEELQLAVHSQGD